MSTHARAQELATRIVSEAESQAAPLAAAPLIADASVEGTPALVAWHGFARDDIKILPPPSQFVSLSRKIRAVFSHAPKTGRPVSFFHVGKQVILPKIGSKSYIVRPLSHQTAQRDPEF